MSLKNILPYGGEAYYFRDVFDEAESELLFQDLQKQVPWKHESVKLFGKEIMQPRLTAWFGDADKPYTYSGLTLQPGSWTNTLLRIKEASDRLSGVISTSALLNLYRGGTDYMGWHRDNEKMLGKSPVIASVSFGCPRTFQFRDYHSKKNILSIELQPGSVLIMKGESQQQWEHRLPKQRTVAGVRINITFRVIQ